MIGKSIYVWDVNSCYGGKISRIATELKKAGFESAILHSANLAYWRDQKRVDLISALKDAGIEPIGGAAVYGADPTGEAAAAAAICNDYDLPAFVFDAESKFDAVPNSDRAAASLLQKFRELSTARIGWCWWAMYQSPTSKGVWHPVSVLRSAMAIADFGMPMMYWNWGDDPLSALRYAEESWKQWRAVTDKPIVPIGRAYHGDGGIVFPESVTAFHDAVVKLGAVGVCWWSMQHALALAVDGIWDALAALPSHAQQPDEPIAAETAVVLVNRINFRAMPQVASHTVITQLPKGTQGRIVEIKQDGNNLWAKVQIEGWMAVKHNGQTLVDLR
jgi:hypothetical protein